MADLAAYANAGGIIYAHFDKGVQTGATIDDVRLAVFPVSWCSNCGGDRPHHGPFCCSCGQPNECWLGCSERGRCPGCHRPLCIDHSPDFYGCSATGDWHDWCHDIGCGTCQDQAAREWVEEHR